LNHTLLINLTVYRVVFLNCLCLCQMMTIAHNVTFDLDRLLKICISCQNENFGNLTEMLSLIICSYYNLCCGYFYWHN
jgi:hypothetical protein